MRDRGKPTWPQFLAWALCGASSVVVLLGAFTVGPFAVLPIGAFAGLAVWLGGGNISAVGNAAGIGVWGLVLAWLNRHGPGDVCSHTIAETTCSQEWSPWPFLAAAILLVGVAVAMFVSLRRRPSVRGVA